MKRFSIIFIVSMFLLSCSREESEHIDLLKGKWGLIDEFYSFDSSISSTTINKCNYMQDYIVFNHNNTGFDYTYEKNCIDFHRNDFTYNKSSLYIVGKDGEKIVFEIGEITKDRLILKNSRPIILLGKSIHQVKVYEKIQ